VTIPLLLLMTYIVQRTRAGKAMRATAQDQDAARLMGIDVDRTIAFTFALGGAMAGAAGLLYLQSVGTTRYDAGFQLGLIAFTAAVLGGIGNLNGAVLGGFLIGVVQSFNDQLGFGQKWSQTVVFTILIALMVFKPEGILGKPTTEKV
jgi:branched-chain amino acid transport system permease protein